MAKNYEPLSAMERALIQAKLETGLQALGLDHQPELKRCGWQGQSTAAPRLRTRGINRYWCEATHTRCPSASATKQAATRR